MKKSAYYVILSILFLVSAYQIATFEFVENDVWHFLKSIWAVLLFIVLFWSKKIFIGKGWFSKKQTPYKPSYTLQDNISKNKHLSELTELSKTEKQAYIELAKLCCSVEVQNKIIPFLSNLQHIKNEYDYDTLHTIIEFLIDNDCPFIISLDWKQEVSDFELVLKEILKENYNGLRIDFPRYNNNVFLPDVLEAFNNALKKHGLQIGFMDTQSDEYVFVVHKVMDKESVSQLFNDIGYPYLENLE